MTLPVSQLTPLEKYPTLSPFPWTWETGGVDLGTPGAGTPSRERDLWFQETDEGWTNRLGPTTRCLPTRSDLSSSTVSRHPPVLFHESWVVPQKPGTEDTHEPLP